MWIYIYHVPCRLKWDSVKRRTFCIKISCKLARIWSSFCSQSVKSCFNLKRSSKTGRRGHVWHSLYWSFVTVKLIVGYNLWDYLGYKVFLAATSRIWHKLYWLHPAFDKGIDRVLHIVAVLYDEDFGGSFVNFVVCVRRWNWATGLLFLLI